MSGEVTTLRPRRYRQDDSGKRRLVRVFNNYQGFVYYTTIECSGCVERGDYGSLLSAAGCEECGYTTKRVIWSWEPFDFQTYSLDGLPWGYGRFQEAA